MIVGLLQVIALTLVLLNAINGLIIVINVCKLENIRRLYLWIIQL